MDCKITENYFKEKLRMSKFDANECICRVKCADCPLSNYNNGRYVACTQLERIYPEDAIAIVQKWSDDHPLPKPKTYADDFFEKFPNARKDEFGNPCACRRLIYGHAECASKPCFECWSEAMPE